MRLLISLLALFAFPLRIFAQQSHSVTPDTLSGWIVTGAAPNALAALDNLVLPAGVQIARSFNSNAITIKLMSKPSVGLDPLDWPLIEIGDAALVFAANEKSGRLLLIIGDEQPLSLPFFFPPNGDEFNGEPFAVAFNREGSSVSVTFAGETARFTAKPLAASKAEIVFSSGSTRAWDFKVLEIVVSGKSSDSQEAKASGSQPLANNAHLSHSEKMVRAKTRFGNGELASSTERVQPKIATDVKVDDPTTLEVYTPPAVRQSRADLLRKALSNQSFN